MTADDLSAPFHVLFRRNFYVRELIRDAELPVGVRAELVIGEQLPVMNPGKLRHEFRDLFEFLL